MQMAASDLKINCIFHNVLNSHSTLILCFLESTNTNYLRCRSFISDYKKIDVIIIGSFSTLQANSTVSVESLTTDNRTFEHSLKAILICLIFYHGPCIGYGRPISSAWAYMVYVLFVYAQQRMINMLLLVY